MQLLAGFAGALAVIGTIFFIITRNNSARETKKLNEAAARLMKEEYLSSVLAGTVNQFQGNGKKLLIHLSWNENGKHDYVLDPAGGILFGRDQKNHVVIDFEKVSSVHCRILLNRDTLYVQDMNSLNGTFLIRGGKTYRVQNPVLIRDGDILQVGGAQFRIMPFYFDLRGI